jgi:hypothetical protein
MSPNLKIARRPKVDLAAIDELNAIAEPAPPPGLSGAVSRLRRYLNEAADLAEERWPGATFRDPRLVVELAAIIAADVNTTPERDR